MLDPAGVTRTKALGAERMARKLRDALPGGDHALRAAVWEFMRPMLSPALAASTATRSSSTSKSRHRRPRRASGESDLDELDLGIESDAAAD